MNRVPSPRSSIVDWVSPGKLRIVRDLNEVVDSLLNLAIMGDGNVSIFPSGYYIESLNRRRWRQSPNGAGSGVVRERIDAIDDLLQQRPLSRVLLNPERQCSSPGKDSFGRHEDT